jgi:hypothetical protein
MRPGHRHGAALWLVGALLALFLATPFAGARAAEEPHGLLLRRGLIAWQMPLAQARPLVEENIRPKTLQLLANQKPEGFGCQPQENHVTRCVWACCVDLGERDLVHFATLSFYDDKFFAYDLTFNTNMFPQLGEAIAARFGPPSRETQETRSNFNALRGGLNSYVVSQRRWDVGDVAVLLFDRGGGGGELAGELYVAYRPLARQATPPKPQDEAPPVKLPF